MPTSRVPIRMQDVICQAIREKRLLELHYDGQTYRVVGVVDNVSYVSGFAREQVLAQDLR